jgi:hypothetical protein
VLDSIEGLERCCEIIKRADNLTSRFNNTNIYQCRTKLIPAAKFLGHPQPFDARIENA